MSLELRLLGRPQLRMNGQPAVEISAHKALALFYYLAATGQTHSRQALAGLLWSDFSEDAARRNLRVELNRLRRLFGEYLFSTRDILAFKKDLTYQLDVEQFDACLHHPDPTPQQIQAALDLYQGDFLADFHVRDAALFEEWQNSERERLRQAAQRLTLRLIRLYSQARAYDAAIRCAQGLLEREPWLEEGHQQLMMLYARTGQRAMALAQYELCAGALEREFGVPPSDETNDLYDRILSGEIGPESRLEPEPARATINPIAPLPQPVAPPFQTPPMLLHFVGREQELAAMQAWATSQQGGAIYSLVGMGGVGKSALAVQFAHALRGEFADGVLWAHVATSDPLDILGNWGRALGYTFGNLSDAENRAAALRGALADKRVLIVLDDVRSVARTRLLMVGGARASTLITTRDLDVASALNAQPYRLGELAPSDGLRLLTRILGEERVNAEPEAARAIGELLQHLPLAVEITAQRLFSRPRRRLVDMAERLRNVEERLDLSISDRAVRTSFQVSWEALDNALKRIFALLGVFEGRTFAAPVLAHMAGLDLYTAEDRLFALTALSLVGEEAQDRYRQHPLLADFAAQQLGHDPEARLAMAGYFQEFAARNQTNYLALRPEWENLMAGMSTAHRLQQWPLVLAYSNTLTQAWFVRARYAQARQGYAWAAEAAQALTDIPATARTWLKWAEACIEQNDYAEATHLLEQSLRLFQQFADDEGVADVKFWQARVKHDLASYDEATELLADCLALRTRLGHKLGIASAMYWQAGTRFRTGDYEQAAHLCQAALSIQEAVNDKAGQVRTLRLLIDICLTQQDAQTAYGYGSRALEICHELADQGELAASSYSMAVVLRNRSELQMAQKYAEDALVLFQRMGDRRFQAVTLYELSAIQEKSKDYENATQLRLQSLKLLREQEDIYNLVVGLYYLGELYVHQESQSKAHETWSEALELAIKHNHPFTKRLQNHLDHT
jgi:DNA-binding SARP family transcriptional activator/tetratricopeptide (TPR) repeat protein